MSHFLLFPTNSNGLILDEDVTDELVSLANSPFDFNDFFIYSHGWWTDANRAMAEYNRFSVDFARLIRSALGAATAPVVGTGIHWPSMLSEDSGSITNYLEALSFYTMEKRADAIGEHGGFTLLRTLLDQLAKRSNPCRIHFIGHSFGCKVISSSLQEIAADGGSLPATVSINVILLQGALDNNSFDPSECYEQVLDVFPSIRFLISTSTEDLALQKAYPEAHRLANLFGHVNPAMGAAGPSAGFLARFAGLSAAISVDVGFKAAAVPKANRLIVADLSALHRHDVYSNDPLTGHHSDVFQPEIYELLFGFLF